MSERAVVGKAMLLINLKQGASSRDFRTFFESQDFGAGLERDDITAVKSILMDSSEISGLPHQVLMADSPEPFAAVYQLTSPDTDDLAALAGGIQQAVGQLADWIDISDSALLVGTEVAITRGSGPIEIVMPLRRRRDISHDEFMQSWYGRHTSIGESVEGVRYRQNHVDAGATTRLSEEIGIGSEPLDGVTESFFLTAEDAVKIMGQPHIASEAIEDEKLFIDHSRSQFGFYTILQ